MSTHGTIASSRRLVLQPPLENDAPPNASRPSSCVIPDDLTMEILMRLPVKSLLRFRCVCKSWKSLISSSDFVKNHLHRSAIDPNLHRRRLLGRDSVDKFWLSRSLRSLIDNPSSSPPIFDYLSFDVIRHSVIVGSCNGLICWISFDLRNDYYVRYLNPSTRLESMSPCFTHDSSSGGYCFTIFGFGYDNLSDSYKTIGIFCDPYAKKFNDKTVVKIYTLGRDTSWRKIQTFPFSIGYSSYCSYEELLGKFVSGTLNWLAARPDLLVIVSFDLGNETCAEVLLPPHLVINYEIFQTSKLWVLEGCLCFSYLLNECHQFVLWQMKVYGDTESWTILINISHPDQDVAIDYQFYYYITPIFMLDNGEVLLRINARGVFIVYNPRHSSFKYLEFQSDGILFDGTTHIESPVSPFPTIVN